MNSTGFITLGLFLLLVGLSAYLSVKVQLQLHKAQRAAQERKDRLALQLHPAYQKQVTDDRQYQLETAKLELARQKQAADIDLAYREFALKQHVSLTRVQPETYLLDYEPQAITALPSLKPTPAEKAINLIGSSPLQLPTPYDLSDIFAQYAISPDHIFLGKDERGEPIFVKASQLHHGAFNASTGRGKSLVERGILAQLLYIGHSVILADLKFSIHTEEGLDYRPIAKRLYAQPEIEIKPGYSLPCLVRDEAEIALLLHWAAYTEMNRRKELRARGIYNFPSLDIFLEELLALIKAYPHCADDILRIIALGRW